jgi:hypothetical protein
VYAALSDGFANKFRDAVTHGTKQIHLSGTEGIVYIVVVFDDFTLSNYKNYRSQIVGLSRDNAFNNLFVKIGLLGNKRISTKGCARAKDKVTGEAGSGQNRS